MTETSSSLLVVPPEIGRFFRGTQPKTLTVRGSPGAGKSSFALATLSTFPGFRVFVTTTVEKSSLQAEFPWLGDARSPAIDLIEFLRFRSSQVDSAIDVSQMRTALQERATDLVDVASVLSLPIPLHEALEAHANEPKMVAIDSWEAWMGNLLGPSPLSIDVPTTRWELERSILGQILRTGAHVVMVAERAEPSRFDFIADGVVTLTATEFEGRQERWIALSKLRGTEVVNPSYPFTLEGARFHCLIPSRPQTGPFRLGDEPDPAPSDPALWPGSSSFAQWFGRIPPMGYVLMETDSETPVLALWRLAAPAIFSALRAGGRVLVRPPGNLTPAGLRESFVPALPSADALDRLAVVVPTASPTGNGGFALARLSPTGEYVLPASAGAPTDATSSRKAVVDFLGASSSPLVRNLVVIFPDAESDLSQAGHSTDTFLGVPGAARRAGCRFGALVAMHSDDPLIEQVRVRSIAHIAARTRRGQLFLYAVRPWTPLLAPSPAAMVPQPASYQLIPVV